MYVQEKTLPRLQVLCRSLLIGPEVTLRDLGFASPEASG